ncbi:hypothetical protein BJ165DRAFT_230137 [Panaeolus papilionaceus]|nr:hypothetical protein BJ165DRAFT_230137 [Panaeolus papilionaceus]
MEDVSSGALNARSIPSLTVEVLGIVTDSLTNDPKKLSATTMRDLQSLALLCKAFCPFVAHIFRRIPEVEFVGRDGEKFVRLYTTICRDRGLLPLVRELTLNTSNDEAVYLDTMSHFQSLFTSIAGTTELENVDFSIESVVLEKPTLTSAKLSARLDNIIAAPSAFSRSHSIHISFMLKVDSGS